MRHLVPLALAATLLTASPAMAELRVASVFTSHMVLQQGMEAPVWGWAEPGAAVTVAFAGKQARALADVRGKWSVRLPALEASARGKLLRITSGDDRIELTDVLVGEVWLCSGQSNMGWSVAASKDAGKEIADADNYPKIRLFKVVNQTAQQPAEAVRGEWAICSSETVPRFSGVGYFFGRALHRNLNVPIGLIQSAWGGTPAQAWTRRAVLDTDPFQKKFAADWDRRVAEWDPDEATRRYEKALAEWEAAAAEARKQGKRPPRKPRKPGNPADDPHRPGVLYNGMIAPLIPLAIRGAIWYQGESNAGMAYQYRTLFPMMIRNWRKDWGQGDFPFLFVQLANFLPRQTEPVQSDATWPFLREAQTMTLNLPNTAMACAIDVGETRSIHPKNKQDVGARLALAARAVAYDQDVVYSGPMFREMEIRDGKAVLRFDHVGGGLTSSFQRVHGFAIAGADRQWRWADARIVGDTVVVQSAEVPDPVAVRYSWANNPIGTLFNKEGLPASPFRTDDWPGDYGPTE